jgi:hypothetical protein
MNKIINEFKFRARYWPTHITLLLKSFSHYDLKLLFAVITHISLASMVCL